MARIFISYRRSDSAGYVGRLVDRLLAYYEPSEIFRDVETIAPGTDFVAAIHQAVGSCDALLAVIGPEWIRATDAQGRRRLDDPRDFVRLEIAAALGRGIRVIPVLVGGARMPALADLPPELAALARQNATELGEDHERFVYDVERLVEALGGAFGRLILSGPADPLSQTLGLTATMGLFPIQVLVDRQRLAKVEKAGNTMIKVKAGTHTLHLRSLIVQSNTLSFSVKGGQTLLFSFGLRSPREPYGRTELVLKAGPWSS